VANSILAHPFVPGKEIAEALIIVFASMFFLLLATPLAPSMALYFFNTSGLEALSIKDTRHKL
jgi:hypothetical protein